jgi:hypothetical protein
MVDAQGIPLAVRLSAANVHDCRLFEAVIDAVEPIRRPRGRPRKRPAKLHADKGYDAAPCRRALRRRGIRARIARRRLEPRGRLGRHRWVILLDGGQPADQIHAAIAHEIAHAWLGHESGAPSVPEDPFLGERQAAQLAREWGLVGDGADPGRYPTGGV